MRCPWGGTAAAVAAARRFYGAGRNGGAAARPQRRGGRTARLRTTRSRTRRLPPSTRGRCHATKSPSAANTPRRRCWATCWTAARGARCTRWLLCAARLGTDFSNNPAVNRRVCEMTVRDLPFKNLVLNTSGIIRYPAAEALLALANGRLFSRGGTVRAERGRSRKG